MKPLLAVLAFLVLSAPTQAATFQAAIRDNPTPGSFFFDPGAITVNQGDAVNWTNNSSAAHTVTSAGFDSGFIPPAGTFNHTFDSPGTYDFECSIHPSMTGSVNVLGPTAVAKATPSKTLTNTAVSFDGTASSHNDPTGTIDTYEWDFDDGSPTESGASVQHSFTDPGTYAVVLTVTDGNGATDTATVSVTVALTAIRISNVRVREGDSGTRRARFVVRLTRASTLTTTVHFATVRGTARSPRDYRAKNGNLTFLPGQLTKIVVVRVRGDLRDERSENFFVRLSYPGNAIFFDAKGRGTILDDD